MSVDDVRDLVAKEREGEAQLSNAKEQASQLVEKAKDKAKQILSAADDPAFLRSLCEQEIKRAEEKKKLRQTECDKALERLKTVAQENMQITLDYVTKLVFEA